MIRIIGDKKYAAFMQWRSFQSCFVATLYVLVHNYEDQDQEDYSQILKKLKKFIEMPIKFMYVQEWVSILSFWKKINLNFCYQKVWKKKKVHTPQKWL